MVMGRKVEPHIAAKEAGVHRNTIVRWTEEGKLTDHRTAGNHRRVDMDELRAVLESRRGNRKSH